MTNVTARGMHVSKSTDDLVNNKGEKKTKEGKVNHGQEVYGKGVLKPLRECM
jgi:hypothetical protein